MLPDRVPLSEYQLCANALGCSPDIVRAIGIKETHNRDENPNAIRCENGHWRKRRFASREAKAFDRVSNSNDMENRWARFNAMDEICKADALLNPLARDAAILCHSFGWCQIMGFNHVDAGFGHARNFLEAMRTLPGQRSAFVSFVKSDEVLHEAFRTESVQTIALHYNGTGYRKNKYDTEIRNIVAGLRQGGAAYA